MTVKKFEYREVPLQHIEADSNQPRKDYKVQEYERLFTSIKKNGLLDPLDVYQVRENRYLIIDGARRHFALQQLKISPVPCHVYSMKISKWELQYMRFELQTVRKNWKPMEKSNALQQIKVGKRLRTNRELAEFLGMPVSSVQAILSLRNEKMEYLERMEHHKLEQNYREEFVRLRPKLRRIRDIDIDQAVDSIFAKVHHGVIPRAKDFRKLNGLFLHAHMHEEPLHEFLQDPDMTVEELEARARHSTIIIDGEKLLKDLGKTLARGSTPTQQELQICKELHEILGKIVERQSRKQSEARRPAFQPAYA